MHFSHQAPKGIGGATLVEVTIAIGIFAFAVLAIWGSLQVGAQTAQQAKQLQYVAQIQQGLFAKAEEGGETLPLESSPAYFDGEGLSVTDTTWVYQAYFESKTGGPVTILGAEANTNLTGMVLIVKTRNGAVNKTSRLFVAPNS